MIKFRAWVKESKKMIHVGSIDLANKVIYYSYWQQSEEGNNLFGDAITFDETVLMQSTGLFDKNGKEIFEGDVVKCCRLFNDSLSEYVGQVKFVDFGWNIVDKADTHDPFYNYKDGFPDEIREIEVIGNIYQNSDLLESVEE
ncbi:YopX family protein [Streptococcus agalactiae]|uniref:YopX family protein n=1 Tax=Streptococcus agalactiae TaxID=1311 RepID=UPI00133186BE|nr:YopX family protein [Streptococcus agalactiae]KAF1211114.1 hypothetical protein B8V42_02425 [Streptococcus agalactiae]HEN0543459.1 hypothetical protein [Streptococcus agalactiae]